MARLSSGPTLLSLSIVPQEGLSRPDTSPRAYHVFSVSDASGQLPSLNRTVRLDQVFWNQPDPFTSEWNLRFP